MTQAKLKEAKLRAREWRRKNPKRAIKASADWKARNPDWWKGRKYVQLLTSALVRGNAKSKVFKEAGLTMDEWLGWGIRGTLAGVDVIYSTKLGGALSNGAKLVPVRSWIEFNQDDLDDKEQAKAFLAPGNFKLVGK